MDVIMNKVERIRQAKRRGWHIVEPNLSKVKSFNDLTAWCEKYTNGYYIYSFSLNKFAFEQGKDANWFLLRWS
jgi:hypothetical protein